MENNMENNMENIENNMQIVKAKSMISNNLLINFKMLFHALKDNNITKADIEKKIIEYTTNDMADLNAGTLDNNEIDSYIKDEKFSECKSDSDKSIKNWKDLYKAITDDGYCDAQSAKIAEINKKGIIKYRYGTQNEECNKEIELVKTGFSKTISLVLAKNAMKEHDVDGTKQKKIIGDRPIDKEILNIVNGKEQEYQKKLIETFLIELKKCSKDINIKDVLVIVCKEIPAKKGEFVIELNGELRNPKKEICYYFYKQKLKELDKAKKELDKIFEKREEYFTHQNKELIIESDRDINDKINEINIIKKYFKEKYDKNFGSENNEDSRKFQETYMQIINKIDQEKQKELEIDDFKKLGVGFIKGNTIKYKEKIEKLGELVKIEAFKTKFKYSVLGAIAYIGDDDKEKNIDSDSKNEEELNLLGGLLEHIAIKSDGKWIQKNGITEKEIKKAIEETWNPDKLINKPVFAALTYYNTKGEPVVNFISKGELRPAYSYTDYNGKKYMTFMIPEKVNNCVEPKYYVFNEEEKLVSNEKIPFKITHNIVDCKKAIAYDVDNNKMEFIGKEELKINIKDNNIVDKDGYLSNLLKEKYISKGKIEVDLEEYRGTYIDDALFINEIKEEKGGKIEEDKEYVKSSTEEDKAKSEKGSEILKRRWGMLGAGEGRFR